MHLAIIMDGNGRWASSRLLGRTLGHKKGAEKIHEITEFCARSGVEYLSLYAFSTENWRRPRAEVEFLMSLLGEYLDSRLQMYLDNNVRLKTIGDLSAFSPSLRDKIEKFSQKTCEQCSGLTQILALNYGAKDELRRAFLRLFANAQNQKLGVDLGLGGGGGLSEADIEAALDTADLPPVDMLVRTGGQMRLSNFLLWQCAYAELFFTHTLWPDFTAAELAAMLAEFHTRERRFGGL